MPFHTVNPLDKQRENSASTAIYFDHDDESLDEHDPFRNSHALPEPLAAFSTLSEDSFSRDRPPSGDRGEDISSDVQHQTDSNGASREQLC